MFENQRYPAMLCGDSGTRLLPLSRKNKPRVFMQLVSDESLFGRLREPQPARGLAVDEGVPYDNVYGPSVKESGQNLVNSFYFRLFRIEGRPRPALRSAWQGHVLVLPLAGSVSAQAETVGASAEQCFYAESSAALDFEGAGVNLAVSLPS